MTRLLTAADYKREIAQLNQLLAEERELQSSSPSFSGELMVSSLEARKQMLEEELHAHTDADMAGQELNVILEGHGVWGHKIDTEVMGKVLLDLQHLVNAVYAGASNVVAQTGRFPQAIRKHSTLRFAGSFAGSFGMRLEAVQEQRELDGSFPLAPTINTVVDLVNTEANGEELHELLLSTGERARKSFAELVTMLSKHGTSMRVEWPTTEGSRSGRLTVQRAKELKDSLKEIEVDEVGHYYEGELDAADKRHGRFGFLTLDGQNFQGIVEEHIIEHLKQYFGRVCRAYIVTRTSTHVSSGVKRVQFRLQELAEADEPIYRE